MPDFDTLNAICIGHLHLPSGPGDVAIGLAAAAVLLDPDGQPRRLEPGELLFVDAGAACVRDAVHRHYAGPARVSEFRVRLARALGLVRPKARRHSAADEAQLDDWIDRHAVFSIRCDGLEELREPRTGWLGDGGSDWLSRQPVEGA